jgi:hypothetical protein
VEWGAEALMFTVSCVCGAGAPEQGQYKPTPLSYKAPAPSHVDQVLITHNESGDFLVKVNSHIPL